MNPKASKKIDRSKARAHSSNTQVLSRPILFLHFGQRAFTVLELVVVVVLLGLLALIACPALGRAKPGTRSAQCLANMRALMGAWQMYAQDNNDKMVIALHGGATLGGAGDPVWGTGWCAGWLDWGTAPNGLWPGSDNTNTILLVDQRYAKLAKYLPNARTYRCPSDTYLSPAQVSAGWLHRCRTYSENIYIGAGNAEMGPTDPLYKHIVKCSQLLNPLPAEAWVFTEEHPDSINDPAFWAPHQTSWIDVPSVLHNGATPFAFADGHSEMHRWEGSLTAGRATRIIYSESAIGISVPVGDPDIHWLSYHSVRVSTNSY